MNQESTKPTCRYGHGDLEKVVPGFGARDGVFLVPLAGPIKVFNVASGQVIAPGGYAFNIYKCPKCSYLEFHDTELPPYLQAEV